MARTTAYPRHEALERYTRKEAVTPRKPKDAIAEVVRSVRHWIQQVDREREAREKYERLMRQRLSESVGMSDDINRAEAAVRHFRDTMEKGTRRVMMEAIEAVKTFRGQ